MSFAAWWSLKRKGKGHKVIELGKRQELKIVKMVEFGVYLAAADNADEKVLLPRKEVPEGVGIGDLQAVAKLIDDDDQGELGDQLTNRRICGEQQTYLMAQQKEGHRHQYRHQHDKVETCRRRVVGRTEVALTGKMTDAHGNRCRQTIIYHEKQLRQRGHNLMGGKGQCAYPSYNDGHQGKSGGLHAHLKGQGPS